MKKSTRQNGIPDKEELFQLLGKAGKPLALDMLLRIASIARKNKKLLLAELNELENDGRLQRLPGGAWVCSSRLKSLTGTFSPLPAGGGLVVPDGKEHSAGICIQPYHTAGAWRGDRVRLLILPGSRGQNGKIVEILEHADRRVLARVESVSGRCLRCRATDKRLHVVFEVQPDGSHDLPGLIAGQHVRPGTLVAVEPQKELAPDIWAALLANVFGNEDDIAVQEAIVKSTHHVPGAFPEDALAEAAMAAKQPPAPGPGRVDMRHIPFVTIDGADARDFDDAIHVEKTAAGWRLRVAIADVSHYVRPNNSGLDAEARRRGNSWYFPRSVEPMLPEALSSGLCSLRPGEDRLAMLVDLDLDSSARIRKTGFQQILMRSVARLTYDQVELFLSRGEPAPAIGDGIANMLGDAFSLYRQLAGQRKQRGALDFDLPEPAYRFKADGSLKSMSTAERGDANRLIEAFMIAANEAVARYLGQSDIPFLYRVHPQPAERKLADLYQTLGNIAVEILPPGPGKELRPQDMQTVLQRAMHTPLEYVVNRLCLRSMQQARYQTENMGHFGLASSAYCHFTSPIRRYADLATHRALKAALGLEQIDPPDREQLEQIGEQLNRLERTAMECEREISRRLGCIALKSRESGIVSGIVSGVAEFGAFVEFDEIPTEGLMRLSSLGNDWFELDAAKQCLRGRHTGQTWRLGQPVEVLVTHVDLDNLEIQLEPAGSSAPGYRRNFSGKHGRIGGKTAVRDGKSAARGRKSGYAERVAGKSGRAGGSRKR